MRVQAEETALQAVIAYKWVKGLVQILLAMALSLSLLLGWGDNLSEWAHEFRNHSTRAWAVLLSRVLETATTPRGMHITLAALWLDGVVTVLEGWALRRRHWWGPWLVVGVSGSLLPFEVVELFRHFRWSRLLVLVVNAAVVVFLVRYAQAHTRELRRPPATTDPGRGPPLHPDG